MASCISPYEIFTDQAFESIIDKISAAKKTLEWVIEQTVAVKEVTSEKERKHYENDLAFRATGNKWIPDTSYETFIAGLEGRW